MTLNRRRLSAPATAAPVGSTFGLAVSSSPAVTLSEAGQSWDRAVWVAITMIAFVALKIHELYPPVGLLRPAMLSTVVGTMLLISRTPRQTMLARLRRPLPRLVLAYYVWAILGIPLALWKGGAIEGVRNLLPPILLFVGILMCPPTKESLDKLQFWWVTLLAAFIAIGQATAIGYRGAFGYTYDPNDLAALMTLAIPLAAGVALREKKARRLLAIAAVIVFVSGIVVTRSRGGVLGGAVGVIVYLLATRGARKLDILVLVAIGSIATWTMASDGFRNRISTMTELEDDYNMTSDWGRKAVWTRGLSYVARNPITGVGIDNFSTAEGINLASQGRLGKWSAAHNAYVQAFAELGIPGGTIYVLMILTAVGIGVRYSRGVNLGSEKHLRPEYVASPIGYAVSSIFLSHAYFPSFFGLLGLLALADRVSIEAGRVQRATPGPVAATPLAPVRRPGERGGYAYPLPTVWRRNAGL